MGKSLRKAELLREIGVERTRLDALLEQLTPRQMTQRGVTLAGWSVKDILAHLIAWQRMNLEWYAVGRQGETPDIPANWKEIRKVNDWIYRKHRRSSLKSVLADYHDYHLKMLELIRKVPARDFATLGRIVWTGPTWTLSDCIRWNTASHYRWAWKHIQKWFRAQMKTRS
jgi:hypothetical protein